MVHKVANHGKLVWLKDLISGEVKGRYHVNVTQHYLPRIDSEPEGWEPVADLNTKIRKDVKECMKQLSNHRLGLDPTDEASYLVNFFEDQHVSTHVSTVTICFLMLARSRERALYSRSSG